MVAPVLIGQGCLVLALRREPVTIYPLLARAWIDDPVFAHTAILILVEFIVAITRDTISGDYFDDYIGRASQIFTRQSPHVFGGEEKQIGFARISIGRHTHAERGYSHYAEPKELYE